MKKTTIRELKKSLKKYKIEITVRCLTCDCELPNHECVECGMEISEKRCSENEGHCYNCTYLLTL